MTVPKENEPQRPKNDHTTHRMSSGRGFRRYFDKGSINQNRKEYYTFNDKDYVRYFFNDKTGGYVVARKGHGTEELENNLSTALILANNGDRIVLQKRSKQKSFDALRNGESAEFKMILDVKGVDISNAIQNHFRRGIGQSPDIVIHINQKMKIDSLIDGLKHAIANDDKQYYKNITIINKRGDVAEFTADEARNGNFIKRLKK